MRYTQRKFTEVPHLPQPGLGSVTWDQRRRMTAEELIRLMGPLHVNHPQYKARPRSLLPIPNIAGIRPVYESTDETFWSLCKRTLRWMAS